MTNLTQTFRYVSVGFYVLEIAFLTVLGSFTFSHCPNPWPDATDTVLASGMFILAVLTNGFASLPFWTIIQVKD